VERQVDSKDGQGLEQVLVEFARTLVTDFPIQGILDHLVERIVDVLPISGAGVTLISPGNEPHYIAASNDAALRYEQLQTEVGEGPCTLAYQTGTEVAVSDLAADDRFPVFAARAIAAGLAAVFTFPLRHDTGRLGALDLYRDTPGPLDPKDLAAAQTLADVTAAYLLNAKAREDARETSDRFRRGSLYDSLTGLPNKVQLGQRLEHAGQRARRSHTHAGVLFIDLDKFKDINDTHGHQIGDHLLRAVAGRLTGLVRPGDTLARVYGDEFVFLCEDLASAEDIEAIATRVIDAFTTPFTLDKAGGLQLEVTASVGLAYAGPGEEISNQLVVNADIAMYQAKRNGGAAHQIVDLRQARQTSDRNNLQRNLKDAFAQHKLDLAYQPIVDTRDGRVTAVEALLRWVDPNRGPIPSRTMIDVAEENGLITEIGAWVLDRACRDRGTWLGQHPAAPLDLAVNVSPRQLMDLDFAGTVAAILDRTGMDPAALILEMTESVFIDDPARAMTVLTDLKALGVRLALDDFGTGYSSLRYLRQFPVDVVKIDQGLIADIGREPTATAIIDAVTKLAHVLGLSVTAEGIETQVQREQIAAIGCENAQGFLYARPMPGHDIAARLAAHHGAPLHLPTETTASR
jgi:diguanylate cyclase (GGDEF)-like protein